MDAKEIYTEWQKATNLPDYLKDQLNTLGKDENGSKMPLDRILILVLRGCVVVLNPVPTGLTCLLSVE